MKKKIKEEKDLLNASSSGSKDRRLSEVTHYTAVCRRTPFRTSIVEYRRLYFFPKKERRTSVNNPEAMVRRFHARRSLVAVRWSWMLYAKDEIDSMRNREWRKEIDKDWLMLMFSLVLHYYCHYCHYYYYYTGAFVNVTPREIRTLYF